MDTTKLIVWGLGLCLLLFTVTMCYIGAAAPFGDFTRQKLYNLDIIQTLMIPCAAILALFGVALKELLTSKKEEKKE